MINIYYVLENKLHYNKVFIYLYIIVGCFINKNLEYLGAHFNIMVEEKVICTIQFSQNVDINNCVSINIFKKLVIYSKLYKPIKKN